MEKINIAELLRDCPQGMELYSPIFGKVYLDKVRRYLAIIVTTDRKQGDSKEEFLYDGRYGMNGECMLFPSKGKTSWEGFVPPCQFKDGDVIVASGAIVLFKQVHSLYEEPHVDFYCGVSSKHRSFILKTGEGQHCGKISSSRYATVEEKAELYEAIRDNGYRWNPKTKMLEKLPDPIFKIGQVVKLKGCPYNDVFWRISDIKNYQYIFNNGRIIDIDEQHHYELVSSKFNVDSLIPFESKVLVRTENSDVWEGDIFVRYDRNATVNKFHCIGGWYEKCIPFKGNEWLLGTTDVCNDYYKTWEK